MMFYISGRNEFESPDVLLPPPQYSPTDSPISVRNNDLPLPPPPLPPRAEAPALPPKMPSVRSYTSDSSRTSTPDSWQSDIWSRNQLSGNEAFISSAQVTPDGTVIGNRRKVMKIVPRQANTFNDKVQPELRHILSHRVSEKEPVEV